MLRRVVLHLGMGKTGSSTIQAFLRHNAPVLRTAGLVAFGPGQIQPCPHLDLQDTTRFLDALQALRRQVRDLGADGVIWSLEGLGTRQFLADPARLAALVRELPADDVRIVIYLRRQDTFAASAYLQWNVVHKSYPGPVQPFDTRFPSVYGEPDGAPIADTNLNLFAIVEPWVEAYGLSRVQVRPLERAQLVDGDLLRDFVAAAGLPALPYGYAIAAHNVTFNMELTDMLGMYGSVFDEPVRPGHMDHFFAAFGHDDFFGRPFFTRFELPPATRLQILRDCEPFNTRVAREYLGRPDGVLFREPWPDAAAPYRPYDGLSMEKVVPILMYILMKQHREIAWLRREIQAPRPWSWARLRAAVERRVRDRAARWFPR